MPTSSHDVDANADGNPDDDEDILDPDDPLYGLEQRLAPLKITEEAKQMVRDKLRDAG